MTGDRDEGGDSRLFPFWPKFLGRSKAIWYDLEIVSGKVERFHLIKKLIDQSKMFEFVLIIG
jgi:hypothetical protein